MTQSDVYRHNLHHTPERTYPRSSGSLPVTRGRGPQGPGTVIPTARAAGLGRGLAGVPAGHRPVRRRIDTSGRCALAIPRPNLPTRGGLALGGSPARAIVEAEPRRAGCRAGPVLGLRCGGASTIACSTVRFDAGRESGTPKSVMRRIGGGSARLRGGTYWNTSTSSPTSITDPGSVLGSTGATTRPRAGLVEHRARPRQVHGAKSEQLRQRPHCSGGDDDMHRRTRPGRRHPPCGDRLNGEGSGMTGASCDRTASATRQIPYGSRTVDGPARPTRPRPRFGEPGCPPPVVASAFRSCPDRRR
jgi:hypothetical protein